MGEIAKDLKQQGLAVLIMIGVAVVSVLGMIVMSELRDAVHPITAFTGADNVSPVSVTVNATVTAFIAGFAIVGTFAVVTMLMIVVKGILGVVKGLQN